MPHHSMSAGGAMARVLDMQL